MALDLGTLSATLDIKDGGFSKKIGRAKTDLTDLKKALDGMGKGQVDIEVNGENWLKQAASSAKTLNTALGKIQKRTDVAPTGADALDKASASAKKLSTELDSAAKRKPDVSPKGTGAVTTAANSARKLAQELDNADSKKPNVTPTGAGQLDKAASSAKTLGTNLSGAASSGRGLSVSSQPAVELDKAAGAGGRLRGALESLGSMGALVGVGAAAGGVTAALGAALRVGNNYTNEMNTMSAVSGATAAQMAEVGATARQLGNDIDLPNTSASDAAAAMTELAKGGFSVAESMTAAKGTLQLAAAAGTDAASAATIQSQALQSFGLKADYAAKMSDVLANAANQSSAEIGDIAAGMQQSGAVANQFGLSVEDTAASLSLLSNAGIKGSDAGTLLKSTLLAVTDQSNPAQAAIEDLGLTIYDAQGKFVGMSSLMEQLQDASEGMTDEQYQAATATLFGSDAMRLAGVAAEVGGEGFDKMRAAMDLQGAAADVAAAKTQGLPGAIGQVGNAAEELGMTLYDRVQGPLTSTLKVATSGITGLSGAMASVPAPVLAGGLALIAAKFLDLNGKMSGVTGGMSSFASNVRSLRAEATAAGSNIGTMSAAVQVLGQKSQTIRNMSSAFQSASTPLRLMGIEARETASKTTGLSSALSSAKGGVQTFGGVLSGVANGGMSLMKSGASGLMTMLGGPWGLALGAASTAIGILAQKHQEAAQKEQEHKAYVDQLRDSFDQSTASITANTTEIQKNKAEQDGLNEAGRQFGLNADIIANAMSGQSDAIAQINNVLDASTQKTVEGSDFWKTYKDRLIDAGYSATDFAQALNGSADAQEKLNSMGDSDKGLKDVAENWDMASGKMKDATSAAADLKGKVNEASDAFKEAQEGAAATASEMTLSGDKLSGLFEKIGGEINSMPDNKTINIESPAPAVRDEISKLGGDIQDLPDHTVNVTFPNGLNLVQVLDQMGIQIKTLPDGRVDLSSNTKEERDKLVQLGLAVEDPISGEIKFKDETAQVIQRQQELKLVVRDPITGQVYVNDNTGAVKAALDGLDIKTQTLSEGDVRILDNTDENKRHLEELEIQATTLADGRLAITDTSDENMARLNELGVKTTTMPGGFIEITDTSDANMKKLEDLGVQTRTLPDGKVVISDNAQTTKDNIFRVLGNGAVNTVSEHTVSIVRKIKDIFSNANGGVGFYADGGIPGGPVRRFEDGHQNYMPAPSRAGEDHTAQIAKAGSWRVWAEPETGGEAYIPLSEKKRHRSTQILNQVANGFGFSLIDHAGNAYESKGVSPTLGGGVEAFANGGIRTNGQLHAFVEGKSVGGVKANRSLEGAPYTNAPGMGEWGDCSSTQSAIAAFIVGEAPFPRKFATGSEGSVLQSLGFTMGNGPSGAFRIGWMNGGPGGGHTSSTFPDGTNVEMGGARGNGQIGGGAAAWNDSYYTDHAWIMPMNIPVGNEGLDGMFDGLGAVAASSTTGSESSTSSGTTKKVNGDTGTLFRDGSVLELAAALYSKKTGTAMPDDVVSWGQAMGLYTEIEDSEDPEKSSKDAEKQAKKRTKLSDQLSDAQADLPIAEEDLRVKKMKLDEANADPKASDSRKAAAQLAVTKAQQKVDELNAKIADLQKQIDDIDSGAADTLDAYGGLNQNLPGSSGSSVADAFIRAGKNRGITDRGIEIALAAGLVESELKVFANPAVPESMAFPHDAVGGDADSIGPLQQRGNGAWGSVADRMDPEKAAGMFYDVLDDEDYNTGDAGAHAQRVQRSALPDKYGQRMGEAVQLLDRWGASGLEDSNPLPVTAMANGGILGAARNAQINEGSATLWAEAGPEAYIPLSSNKRARSIDIWAETGKRLGIDVMSMLQLMGSGIPALLEGDLTGFSTGGSISLEKYGLNTDAAAYRGAHRMADGAQQVVGAVFNGPVQVNDPRQWVQGQVNDAGRMLGQAMKGVML